MKVIWRIVLRITVLVSLLLAAWALFFYHELLHQVNDEVDDSLEVFSENLMVRLLRGQALPDPGMIISNNVYTLDTLSRQAAQSLPHTRFSNEWVQVPQEDEPVPLRIMRTVFADGRGGWYRLTVGSPSVESEDVIEAITRWFVILFCALLAAVVGVCAWVIWHSTRPLYRLLSWLEETDISRGVRPLVNPTRITEYRRLNEAVYSSIKRGEELYKTQREFIGNASHEIQTPLAVCINRMEWLADTPLTENQLSEVLKTGQGLAYISRLNRDLLLLSKIDNGQFHEARPIDLALLVRQTLEEFNPIYQHKALHIETALASPAWTPTLDPTLAKILVNNLLKNAFVHSPRGGELHISLKAQALTVANTAAQAQPLDAERIFQRFYQGTKREGSTGLGLALCRAIARGSHLRLDYRFERGLHCFCLEA